MKNHKKISIILGALFLILPLITSSFGAKRVFAEETAAQVILHKKKMTDLPDPLIQNSGKEMSEFDQYQGLADISFSVYNVTPEFYAQRKKGASVDAAKQAVQSLTPGTPIASGTTDADGNVTLSLPKKTKWERCSLHNQRGTKRRSDSCRKHGARFSCIRDDQTSRWLL